jgi:hypothetical protein
MKKRHRIGNGLLWILILALGLTTAPAVSQQPVKRPLGQESDQTDTAVIWRGFDQKWTQANHRLNRLGDYVGGINCTGSSCSANLVHGAASGLAGDVARYTTYYTTLSARGVGFQPGHRTFVLSGKEGQPIEREFSVSEAADANMRNRDQVVVLLNGFDLCAEDAADKPEHFRIAMTNPVYDPDDGTFSFRVIAQLTADCDSAECKPPETVNYNLRVHFLIVGADEEAMHVVSREFSQSYAWNTSDEIHLQDLDRDRMLYGEPGYPVGVFAFRSLELTLDRDHWMFEWASFVRPKSYNGQTGEGECSLALMFKQWTPGMMVGAVKKAGSATMSARVALLQFKEASRGNETYSGSIEWPGTLGGAPSGACSSQATVTHAIQFEESF